MRLGVLSIKKHSSILTPQLMPMSGPFSSMWDKELKMSSLNEGYPLPQCFHFGKPDHDVCESESEG